MWQIMSEPNTYIVAYCGTAIRKAKTCLIFFADEESESDSEEIIKVYLCDYILCGNQYIRLIHYNKYSCLTGFNSM